MEPLVQPIEDPFSERLKNDKEPVTVSSSTEVAAVPRADQIMITDGAMQLTNIEQVWRAARLIRQSGLAPASFRNDQQIVIGVLRAIELKIPIFQALEGMTVIGNKIGIMGDLALALVQASGELKDLSKEYAGEEDGYGCILTIQRKGRKAHSYSYNVGQAKRATLWGRPGPWTQYPDRMLYYRALGFALRDEFPDILKGIKTTEELQDYPQNDNGKQ